MSKKSTGVTKMLNNSDILSVNNVDVHYGKAKALHNINLKMQRGEFLFIVGRNGAGKTTLLKTIAGFLKPSKGNIKLEGQDISNLPPNAIARLGIRLVFQEKKVFSSLTVKENIEIAAYSFNEDLKKALDKVISLYPKLKDFLHVKAGNLSGGQKQILLIGRALIGKPKLLLIDEPTEGIAIGVAKEIVRVLKEMRGEISLIIVEQKIPLVLEMADRVYVMREGKIGGELKREEFQADIAKLEKLLT